MIEDKESLFNELDDLIQKGISNELKELESASLFKCLIKAYDSPEIMQRIYSEIVPKLIPEIDKKNELVFCILDVLTRLEINNNTLYSEYETNIFHQRSKEKDKCLKELYNKFPSISIAKEHGSEAASELYSAILELKSTYSSSTSALNV